MSHLFFQHSGETCAGQVAFGTGPVDVSYNQAVTPNLSMGGQGQFSAAQQAVGLLYGFKYDTPRWDIQECVCVFPSACLLLRKVM